MSDNTDKLVELMQKQNETLEKMDWKLWEMMNMMKDNLPEKTKAPKPLKSATKKTEENIIKKEINEVWTMLS